MFGAGNLPITELKKIRPDNTFYDEVIPFKIYFVIDLKIEKTDTTQLASILWSTDQINPTNQ